jgi:glycosyltransferase involved in cell wall biosynthesis
MLLTVNTGKRKNVMTDSYKDIVNGLGKKDKISAIIPCVYDKTDFSADLGLVVKENFSSSGKAAAIFKATLLALKTRRIIKKRGIKKIFIYYDTDYFNIFLRVFLAKMKVAYYVWMHDPILHSGEGFVTTTVKNFDIKFLYKKAKKIFIAWEGIKNFTASFYGIDEKKIVSIKLPELKDMEFEDIKPAPFEKCDYDLIFYGRIEEYKGIDLLVNSLLYLNSLGKNLRLLIAGTGKAEKKILEKVKDIKNIVFINRYVPDRELAELIAASKIVVMPYRDATGTQAIQVANFYNRPVIASSQGCFPEYVENGVNGFLFKEHAVTDLSKRIMELANDEKLYKKTQSKIPAYFEENFSLKNVTAKLEKEIQYF